MADPVGEDDDEKVDSKIAGSRISWVGFGTIMVPIAALFITLGEASEATFLIRDMGLEIISLVSNRLEYDTLNDLHVGNTSAYIEELLGLPQVSRGLSDDVRADYVHTSKVLVTVFLRDERVVAFTLVPMREGFSPDVNVGTSASGPLLEFPFDRITLQTEEFVVDQGRTGSHYLESFETGPAMRFLKLYAGSVDYGAGGSTPGIHDLYLAALNGGQAEIDRARATLRDQGRPNLYGQGELPLEVIRAALLTNAEFESYFGSS